MLGHFGSQHFRATHFAVQRNGIGVRNQTTFGHFGSQHFGAAHFVAQRLGTNVEAAEEAIHLLASDNNFEIWESHFNELKKREQKTREEVVKTKEKLRQKKKIQLQALDTQGQAELDLHILILQRSIQQASADLNQIKNQMAQIEKERAEWLQVIGIVIEMMF